MRKVLLFFIFKERHRHYHCTLAERILFLPDSYHLRVDNKIKMIKYGFAATVGRQVIGALNSRIRLQAPKRHLWEWLNIVFNRVDETRIKEVGPDRACAEWLLRNGAAVKWIGAKDYQRDYNTLPEKDKPVSYIKEIDATGSSIMHYGFEHLKGCAYIDKIIFHECNHLLDKALPKLSIVGETLVYLQITSCWNITEVGLQAVKQLTKLKTLKLGDLPYVKEKTKMVKELSNALPGCEVTYDVPKNV